RLPRRAHRRARRALLSPRDAGCGNLGASMTQRLLTLVMLVLPVASAAQTRLLTVETNAPDARVFVDSVLVGIAHQSPFAIPPTAQQLALQPPAGSWSVQGAVAPIPEGASPHVRLDLPYHYRIESQPFDATVTLESASGVRMRLGTTPLDFVQAQPLDGVLVIAREGYVPARLTPGDAVWNRHVVPLTPLAAPSREGYAEQYAPRRLWLDAALLGVAVAATAVSVHYKFQADDLFEQYRETGDPELRPRITRLDTKAGIALSVAGAGIGLFSVRLALRR
ncbi:MAG TPA: hypothetical protein VD948_10130, partial [Rhodothermales bacterium]|nr:hypothetical protein [Rhodothermales bacterium]